MLRSFERVSGPALLFIIFLLIAGIAIFAALAFSGLLYAGTPAVSIDSVSCSLSGTYIYATLSPGVAVVSLAFGAGNYTTTVANSSALSGGRELLEFYSPDGACVPGNESASYHISVVYEARTGLVYSTTYTQNLLGYVESRTYS